MPQSHSTTATMPGGGGHRLTFGSGVKPIDNPTNSPVLIIGQHKYLNLVDFNLVKPKFGGKITKEVWEEGLSQLNTNILDSVSLHLNCITLASLRAKVSRHNTPSRAHSIAKTIKSLSPKVP